ncbi:preprotein translocase subunit YajC [Entomobacter blattae]|uniref:Sec translocon accessory complex subunit YajC n=1 Tax=Entomobacter blattae TaxID=2762277 RepID=A0A7H1NUA6_9PROT|nr:preprotein translocase subunit YajC [Entomobacter blattae]QNT79366.1 Preprotein translocase subunit [Entomobacter blattae]
MELLNFFVSPAYAQSAEGGFNSSTLLAIVPYLGVFAIVYFIMIRPQQKKAREHKEQLNKIRRGDKIVTAGGIVGVVQKSLEDSDEIEVEISPGVKVKVIKSTITTVVSSAAAPAPANDSASQKKK